MLALMRAPIALASLALLAGCLPFGPSESDLQRFVTEIRAEDSPQAAGEVEIADYRCRRMSHGQSHECALEYRLVDKQTAAQGQPSATKIWLIVRKVDGEWSLYSHRDKP